MSEILVVGSLGYDTITTPVGERVWIAGGSANYFSVSAALYAPVNVVAIVGQDYKSEDLDILRERNICIEGLKQVPGRTFRWVGRYKETMSEAETLDTQLNVFEGFDPQIPAKYQSSNYVFLANIDPDLQLSVLDQVKRPRLVGVDTMNFWIRSKRDSLKTLLSRTDILFLNETEARELAGVWNTVEAVKKLSDMGPRGIVVKRGEYGFLFYIDHEFFVLPAYPVARVVDPTGAGDTFAGGFFGFMARSGAGWDRALLKEACIHGCILASFTVEDFGLDSLKMLSWPKVESRHQQYRKIISWLPH